MKLMDNLTSMEVRNIGKKYKQHVIYEEFSYIFNTGCYAINGPNGCGKSTFLRIITGAEPIETGYVSIGPISLRKNPVLFKKKIGYCPDKLSIYPFITGREFIHFIKLAKNSKDEDTKELFDSFNIQPFMDKRFEEMSLGTQKKFMLIGALIGNPIIIILDEPTNELDSNTKEVIINYLNSVKKEKIIIFSSHDLSLINMVNATILKLIPGKNTHFS